MLGLKTLSKRSRLTVASIILLGIAIGGYYFIYLNARQNSIKERNFRVLQRINNNLTAKMRSYEQLAKNSFKADLDSVRYELSGGCDLKKDSSIIKQKFEEYFRKKESKKLNFHGIEFIPRTSPLYYSASTIIFEDHDWKLIYRTKVDYLDDLKDPFSCFFVSEITLKDFIEPLIRKDVFHDYIVFQKEEGNENKLIYESFSTGLNITNRDSIFSSSKGFETSTVKDLEIAGIEYKAFLQPMHIGPKNILVVAGLITSQQYKTEKSTLPSSVILGILVVLFLIVLGLPFLKSLMMSPNERLGIRDMAFSGISLVLGTSLAVFVLFDAYIYWGSDMNKRAQNLEKLSDNISANFRKELEQCSKEIDNYNKYVLDTIRIAGQQKPYEPNSKLQSFNIFLIDHTGQQLYKYGSGAPISVAERSYFKNALHGQTWSIGGKSDSEIYMEPVTSWTTGEFRVVVSKKNPASVADAFKTRDSVTIPVTAASFLFHSVVNPVLPLGYGFCIIDEKGEVLFHSDKNKNLNENFFDECNQNSTLKSAVYTRTSNYFNNYYSGSDHKMCVAPIDDLPLYIVTFSNKSYGRSLNTQVFGFTLILAFGLFLFIAAQILFSRLLKIRPSKLKIPQFQTSLLIPVKKKLNAYVNALIFNLITLFLVLLFMDSSRPLFTIYIFFIISIYTLWGNCLFLRNQTKLSLFDSHNQSISIVSILLLFLINLSASRVIEGFQILLVLQILVCSGFVFAVLKMQRGNKKLFFKFRFHTWYILLILSWLLLTSVVPTIKFCEISYNQETQLFTKAVQLELAKEINKKTAEHGIAYSDNQEGGNIRNVYADVPQNTVLISEKDSSKDYKPISSEEKAFLTYIRDIRPLYNIQSQDNNTLFYQRSDDLSWEWNKNSKYIFLNYMDRQVSSIGSSDKLLIRSDIEIYTYPKPWMSGSSVGFNIKGAFFWLGAILALTTLFFIIRFFVNNTFIMDLILNRKLAKVDKDFFDQSEYGKRMFLTGLPYSGKTEYFKKTENFRIDLTDLNDEDAWKQQCSLVETTKSNIIVVDHFEYNSLNMEINRKKLDFLEGLLKMRDKTILIISTVHPSGFLELYHSADLSAEVKEQALQDEDRWNKLLINFYKFYYPLQGIVKTERDAAIPYYIEKECNNGLFLQGLKKALVISADNNNDITKEEVILKIQSLAHSYYLSVWALLTKREQYVLYDLAQDGLVNPKNIETITLLINKGIIVYDGTLQVMNVSFRNFILTVIPLEEVLKTESGEVRDEGNWSKYKTPLIVVIGIISLFIFLTQQDAFSNMLGYVTSLAAGIPLIIKLFSSFSAISVSNKP